MGSGGVSPCEWQSICWVKAVLLREARMANSLTVGTTAITHPDRVISETGHITKGELAGYYAGVAPFLLPRIVRRPLSLLRCPSGIDGNCFYQRNPGRGLGPDVKPFKFTHKGKKYETSILRMRKACWS